ncbi:MAG: hypothetical protein D6706_03820 [Chloroflexi bacterium]|nr:MAG: hypothetical protein D6706_03820 [Chloroflexota bacterium]
MAKGDQPTNSEINEMQNRIEWLDAERRKLTRKIGELEQQLALQQRETEGREKRIQQLEQQLSTITAQLSRIPQFDTQLAQFKDEVVKLIDQYDNRRIQSENELDRLRRVEQEATAREIADIRQDIQKLMRLIDDMELRKAEETRLANLIGTQQNRIANLSSQMDSWEQNLSFLDEKEKQNSRNITELQSSLAETQKRWTTLTERIDILSSKLVKFESGLQTLTNSQEELRHTMKDWLEQIQVSEYERNQKLENFRRTLEEHISTLERFKQEWITFSDQYKEAKMAVQTLVGWQQQIEQQQREASELLRVENQRMRSRWDDFLLENNKKWKTYQVEVEQQWAAMQRRQKQVEEQIHALEEFLHKLEEEKDTLWRVQNAQSDAIKQWARLWLEEVEKAIAQNPNRRRQPALIPVREE